MNTLFKFFDRLASSKLIWIAIAISPLLFIWQSGDLTDTGYNLSVYHFFFERIQVDITDSHIFLAELIGAIWLKLFPFLGVIGIKVLAIIFFYLNIYFSWKIIKEVLPQTKYVAFYMLGAVIFTIRAFPIVFNYDLLTSTLLFTFLFLLRKKKESLNLYNFIYLGLLSAVMFFARIPNIFILFIFPLSLLLLNISKIISIPYKHYVKLICYYFLGFIIGLLSFYILLFVLGWDEAYTKSLLGFLDIFKQQDVYSPNIVLKKYYVDSVQFLYYFFATSILFISTKYLAKKTNHVVLSSLILFLGLCTLSFFPFIFSYNNSIKYILPSITILAFLNSKPNFKIIYIVALIIVCAIIQIAGSNTGIFLKISLLFVLAFPLCLGYFIQKLPKQFKIFGLVQGAYAILFSSLIYLIFIYGIGVDYTIRLKAIFPVESPKYMGIRTTKEQATKINHLLGDIQNLKSEGQKMFIYGHQPMFYYLTDCEPAVSEIWLIGNNLATFPDLFSELSNQKQKPIFLDTKENIFSEDIETLKNNFLNQNKYELVKSTDSYDIWKAKE